MADLLLDADIDDKTMVPLLVAKRLTAWPTWQVGRPTARDDEQLLRATDLHRFLVTHNRKDYVLLAHAWRSLAQRWSVAPEDHAGIIVIPQPDLMPPSRAALEIDLLVRGRSEVWGHVFDYSLQWGWVALV